MLNIRRAAERGHTQLSWLDSKHTFSFANYYDPKHMGFGHLRVINDDIVAPGGGFGAHPHRNMEIISYVIDGALKHKDSMGNSSVIRPGDVQRMTAGTGVKHSEYNYSNEEPVRFLQIWILPDHEGYHPGYEQKKFTAAQKRGRLRLVAAVEGREGAVSLHQDVDMYAALINGDESVEHPLRAGREAWGQIVRGSVVVNGEALEAGDGFGVAGPLGLRFSSGDQAEIVILDMAIFSNG